MRKLAIATFILFVFSGCHMVHSGVIGSGKRAEQKRDVSTFASISLAGAYEVEIACQQAVSLVIDGDDNILPLITTEVSNNVLYVKSSSNFSVHQPVKLRITVPNLDGLTVTGAGSVDVTGIKNERFEIDCSGAPSMTMAGTTKVLDIDTSGAARIDAHKLHAASAIVDSKGVSKVDVDVSDQLDVRISGPSYVTYKGDPVVKKNISGPGKLEKKTSEGA